MKLFYMLIRIMVKLVMTVVKLVSFPVLKSIDLYTKR